MNDKDKKNVVEVDLLNCKIGMNGSGKSFYKKLQSVKNTRDHNNANPGCTIEEKKDN